MPVKVGKRGKSATLKCEDCGREATYPSSSPAAPELSACEAAEKDGWVYTIGFWSMLMGHQVMCPVCAKREAG